MRFRYGKIAPTEEEEKGLTQNVRKLAASADDVPPSSPPDAYWQELIVRTNRRVDEATSTKAISISWAARVAIPGVVALVSFLIAIQYYVPERPRQGNSVTAVILTLPGETIDSLLVDPSALGGSFSTEDLERDVFEIPKDQVAEYLVATNKSERVMEAMTEQEVNDILIAFNSRND